MHGVREEQNCTCIGRSQYAQRVENRVVANGKWRKIDAGAKRCGNLAPSPIVRRPCSGGIVRKLTDDVVQMCIRDSSTESPPAGLARESSSRRLSHLRSVDMIRHVTASQVSDDSPTADSPYSCLLYTSCARQQGAVHSHGRRKRHSQPLHARGAVLSCGCSENQKCPHISPTRRLCNGQDLGAGAATLDRIPRSGKSPHEATPARQRLPRAASCLTNPLGQAPIPLALSLIHI